MSMITSKILKFVISSKKQKYKYENGTLITSSNKKKNLYI